MQYHCKKGTKVPPVKGDIKVYARNLFFVKSLCWGICEYFYKACVFVTIDMCSTILLQKLNKESLKG